jgi:hypothetical protein
MWILALHIQVNCAAFLNSVHEGLLYLGMAALELLPQLGKEFLDPI